MTKGRKPYGFPPFLFVIRLFAFLQSLDGVIYFFRVRTVLVGTLLSFQDGQVQEVQCTDYGNEADENPPTALAHVMQSAHRNSEGRYENNQTVKPAD